MRYTFVHERFHCESFRGLSGVGYKKKMKSRDSFKVMAANAIPANISLFIFPTFPPRPFLISTLKCRISYFFPGLSPAQI